MASPSYRVNSPTVAAETVDGEVLMINLESGSYYSLRDTGAAIWDGIERGAATQTIAAVLADRFPGTDTVAMVSAFLTELAAEQLVVPAESGGDDHPWEPIGGVTPTGVVPPPPALEKFTDMQHLILLDPVHEVDAAEGWPIPLSDA